MAALMGDDAVGVAQAGSNAALSGAAASGGGAVGGKAGIVVGGFLAVRRERWWVGP